jgi:hypothetical protein
MRRLLIRTAQGILVEGARVFGSQRSRLAYWPDL